MFKSKSGVEERSLQPLCVQPFKLLTINCHVIYQQIAKTWSHNISLKITEVDPMQKITKYLECVHCSKGIIQGTCTDMIICEHCGYMMKAESCQTKVVAKIVIKMDDQEVVFKIDHPLLKKMYPGVIYHSGLGRGLLYGLVYNTENFNVLDIMVWLWYHVKTWLTWLFC